LLPATNGDIDVERIKFDDAGDPATSFGSQNCRSASRERIKNKPVTPAAVADQVRDQGDGFDGGVQFELTLPSGMEAIDPGIIENIGPVPPLTSQAEIVDVRRGAVLEDGDQLMLAAIKAALAGVGFVQTSRFFHSV
jgi:hypothetical protein